MKVPPGISAVVTINRKAETPIYRQVYEAFRSAIMDGRLRAGERIPSTRALALELKVSRIPVLNAYAQLLAEGYFESRTGSGTLISRALPNPIRVPHEAQVDRVQRLGPRPLSANRRCHLNRLAIFSYVAGWVPSVWDKSLLNSFRFAYGKHWWHATAARLLTNRLITVIRWA